MYVVPDYVDSRLVWNSIFVPSGKLEQDEANDEKVPVGSGLSHRMLLMMLQSGSLQFVTAEWQKLDHEEEAMQQAEGLLDEERQNTELRAELRYQSYDLYLFKLFFLKSV